MKTCWFIVNPSLFILLMCALPGTGLSQSTSPRNETELLKQMEYNWLMAEFKQDTATIAQMMDDNFMSIGPAGISGKQQELAGMYTNMGKRLKAGHVVDSLYLDDVHIRVHDSTAVVTFISVTKGRVGQVPFEDRRTRMYDVWIRRNGQWKAISSQVTPLP